MQENYNYFEDYKQKYEANDIEGCKACLITLLLDYNTKINKKEGSPHDFKHILFQTNCIKNPMGMKYQEKDYQKTIQVFSFLEELIFRINNPDTDSSERIADTPKIDQSIYHDIWDVLMYTEVIYKMNASNSKRMQLNSFSQEPFIVQLVTSVLCFQDQYRILEKEYCSLSKQEFFTGMELSIADRPVTNFDSIKVSVTDSMECSLEAINEIVRFLYYQFKNNIVDIISTDELKEYYICPYNNPHFQRYLYIAIQRHILQQLEEGIRCGFFTFECNGKDPSGNKVIIYSFEDSKKSHARFCGIYRREHDLRTHVLMEQGYKSSTSVYGECISVQAKILLNKQVPDFVTFNLSNYHITPEDYKLAKKSADTKINAIYAITKQYYLDSEVKGVKIKDLLVCYRYICTMAEIIRCASLNYKFEGTEDNYLKEICIIELDYLCSELARLCGFDIKYSALLLDRFVFHSQNNKYDDVFSQPLLQISNKQIIFSPALVDQINPDRAIERQFIRFKVNTSKIGFEFERYMRETLIGGYRKSRIDPSKYPIPKLMVNPGSVKYKAFDDKDIEFDMVMVLDNYLILTELKAIMTSYDLTDLIERKSNITDAIEQLKRRKESVIEDWSTFRSCVSIDLSDTPFDSDHIILVACSDAYDFTPLQIDGVFITDSSTFLQYFTKPYVDLFHIDKSSAGLDHSFKLWSKGYPTASEFLDYLREPITTQYIDKLIQTNHLPVPYFDNEDLRIAIAECQLAKDPTVALFNSNKPKKKVSKNSRCPCGSGKKFKKCCKGKGKYD